MFRVAVVVVLLTFANAGTLGRSSKTDLSRLRNTLLQLRGELSARGLEAKEGGVKVDHDVDEEREEMRFAMKVVYANIYSMCAMFGSTMGKDMKDMASLAGTEEGGTLEEACPIVHAMGKHVVEQGWESDQAADKFVPVLEEGLCALLHGSKQMIDFMTKAGFDVEIPGPVRELEYEVMGLCEHHFESGDIEKLMEDLGYDDK